MTSSLAQRRAEGLDSFKAQGWPSRALEAWKTTPTKAIIAFGDGQLPEPSEDYLKLASAAMPRFGKAAGPRVVLVGGHFSEALSSLEGLSTEASEDDSELGVIAHLEGAPLVALSMRSIEDALVIRSGDADGRPVEIIHLGTPGAGGSHTRVLVKAQRSEELMVVEHFAALGSDPSWSNSVTEVSVGDNAKVCHIQILHGGDEAHRTGNLSVELGRDGAFESHVVSLGGTIGRSEIQVRLSGKGSHCDLTGLYVAAGKSVLDNYTEIEHLAPHTNSEEDYRGVMSDKSIGGFVGRVLIHEGAIKSETHQLNNNLLLSPSAVVHTRPQLEIDNDDVAATHGSTVGQLDENALFYLASRGLNKEQARALMIWAFVKAQIDRLPLESLKHLCLERVAERLSLSDSWIGELE